MKFSWGLTLGVCGGDGDNLFKFYIDHGYNFIVRLVGDRNLLNWGGRTKDVRSARVLLLCHSGRPETALYPSRKWRGLNCARERNGDLQMEFELLSG